jgi:UDP-N-acetylmuramyl pentapeptide synthase
MNEIHDFDDTVIAILDDEEKAREVTAELSAAGYEYELLVGEEGKAHLDVAGASGTGATIKRLLTAFGDQYRVIEELHAELDDGKLVISIDSKPNDADEVVRILQESGGEFIWKLGTWTYTKIGE